MWAHLRATGWSGIQRQLGIAYGANAKAFAPFLEFMDIRALIITDFDSTKKETKVDKNEKATTSYPACSVEAGTHTSNESLKHFFSAPPVDEEKKYNKWFASLKNGKLKVKSARIKIAYQLEEHSYHARSFEDAFLSSNKKEIVRVREKLLGLKNVGRLQDIEKDDIFDLTNAILNKKSDFAASILYMALIEEAQWVAPKYIKDGLKWISK